MTLLVVAIFALAYVGLAIGRLPGLAVDRSGIAAIAAIAMVALGAVPAGELPVAIHFPTLALLGALMILSARFAAVGAYEHRAARIAAGAGSPVRLLVLTVMVAGGRAGVEYDRQRACRHPAAGGGARLGPRVLQALALTTTLAGNFFLVGSIANLIVAERAAASGVAFGFADHARAGVPMALATLTMAALWLLAIGRVAW